MQCHPMRLSRFKLLVAALCCRTGITLMLPACAHPEKGHPCYLSLESGISKALESLGVDGHTTSPVTNFRRWMCQPLPRQLIS